MKKIIAIFVLMGFSGFYTPNVYAAPIQGHIEETNKNTTGSEKIFTNETKTLETKKAVELTVSQVLNGATAIEGDEFFAEVSKDVLSGSGILLPRGTIAHGTIRNIGDPKRMGRDGYIELSYDYLITPDGREIPIEGGMTSKLNPAKSSAKVIGESVTSTAIGGAVGAVAAVQLLGIEGAVLSQGYTLAGGAAIGGIIALGMSLFRKGQDVLIAPGDEIIVHIQSAEPIQVLTIEAVRQDEIKYEGLDIQIFDIFLEKDPFGNLNTITLDMIIKNNSKTDFSSFDIALVNDLHNSYRPSIFTIHKNSIGAKAIKRGDNVSGSLSFSVDNPNREHWLVFYDRRYNKPLAKISIENIKRDLNISDLKKKGKKKAKIK